MKDGRHGDGPTSPVLGGFLPHLRPSETTDEPLGLADSMQAHAAPVNLTSDSLDIR